MYRKKYPPLKRKSSPRPAYADKVAPQVLRKIAPLTGLDFAQKPCRSPVCGLGGGLRG